MGDGSTRLHQKTETEISRPDPVFQHSFIKMMGEATPQGSRGAFHESALSIPESGFRIQGIRVPLVLWHGEEDQNIPVEMARYFASAAPNCTAYFYPGEGHLSLFKKRAREIIDSPVNEDFPAR